MQTTENTQSAYALTESELTEQLSQQMKTLRGKFAPMSAAHEPLEQTDRLFAAQMAAKLLERTLRPAAITDLDEIRKLVSASNYGKCVTDIGPDDFAKMIADTGAIFRGHFVLLSGKHSEYFFMFSRVATRVAFRKRLAIELASRFRSSEIDSVIAPITAGGLLVQDVASELNANFAFFDVDEHSRPSTIRRGYSVRGSTLVLNDMTTTGEGINRMLHILRENAVKPRAIGLIATRGTLGPEIANNLTKAGYDVQIPFHLNISAFETGELSAGAQNQPGVGESKPATLR